ncbi:ACP S-malonyltransferase [Pseudomonas chlororaphis]|uniref:ACP S-malonyltransferase n=1 Tax=Pseudomonas chlororaphis TaxID=587753 RepID=UPI001B319C2C|nr:ACP S-malonyltransferase [Pseudomonas chlororaphis]MBP5072410.1 ACP S-malonyltransferase [Pseudomonas chlororaphis]
MITTFMFPGQGSQAKGMGGGLFERFKDLSTQADRVLGYSIKELCLGDPGGRLSHTQFTQPALYVVNALTYYARLEDDATPADFVVGHSLGEFNALLAAGCFDFETGLQLVKKRGELMGQISGGAMAAILNANKNEIELTLARSGLNDVGIANYNTPSQFVISGPVGQVEASEALFQKSPMRYLRLNTSGAFHSELMQPAADVFAAFLNAFEFVNPTIPVVANFSARPYENKRIADGLAKQIASPVRWCGSVEYLLELAAGSGQEISFEELGHGEVLTRLVHTIRGQTPVANKRVASDADAPDKRCELSLSTVQKAHRALDTQTSSALEKVEAWNLNCPVGTKVKSFLIDYPSLETCTEAMVLFGHRPVVYMKGYNGYFDIDEVTLV